MSATHREASTTAAVGSFDRFQLPTILIANGTLEALKWLGVLLMTADHVNKYVLGESVPWLFDAGRSAMPLFAFVLAYNLGRPGAFENGVYLRTARRLAVFGALASIPYIGLGIVLGGWWPLNILAAFLVATAITIIVERGGRAMPLTALSLFVVGGALVEFWWPAVGLCLATWSYCRRPNWAALLGIVVSLAALRFVNGNWWAFAALPIIIASMRVDLPIPRSRYAFYVFYPAHLAVLWCLTIYAEP